MIALEFTNDTLVITEKGVERLTDILRRPVSPCLWCIQWRFRDDTTGFSFHSSHKSAEAFSRVQMGPTRVGCARLVDVSKYIYDKVLQDDYYVVENMTNYSEAENYTGTSRS